MSKEEVLIWLTQLGKDWVSLHEVYEVYKPHNDLEFWVNLTKWHDSAYITRRYNTYKYEKLDQASGIEQYKLTKRALELLTST